MALQPRRVLEIGAGSGLVLSQVAPRCEHYVGTDMSAAAIDNLARSLEHLQIPWRDRVQLLTQPAHVIEGLPQGYFDTIILNSVIQYFPNARYLADVIDNAVDLLAPGGTLFIGDVRNHSLQGAFQTAVALARTTTADTAEIRQRVQRAMLGETELLLAPEFFTTWAADQPVSGRTRRRSQTRIGRQRAEPVPLRRHHPQNPHPGTLPGHRTNLGVDPMRRPARTAHPVGLPTSRRRPHHRHPPRRTDHRHPHRTRPGRRATPGRRARPRHRHRDPRHRHPRTTAPPRRNHRIPRRGDLGRPTRHPRCRLHHPHRPRPPAHPAADRPLPAPHRGPPIRHPHQRPPHQHQDQRGASAVERAVARLHDAGTDRGARPAPADLLGQDRP